jgi:predicted phosphodiesterase
MRALVISDIHGNIDALRAVDRQWEEGLAQFDQIVCLGDLVDYGPDASEVIHWVRSHATDVVRGNHDHAMATGESCESAPAYLEASMTTRACLRATLTHDEIAYLGALPLTRTVGDGLRVWHMVHAAPATPLHEYVPPESPDARWEGALAGFVGQRVLLGHTHLAFARPVAGGVVINPGSVGMPKDGNHNGSYAVIRDGAVQFLRIVYDPEPMIRRLRALDLPEHVFEQLARTFRTGS